MNGKTAKLLRRYSQLSGQSEKKLKLEWYSLDNRKKFEKRKEIVSKLQSKKK